MNDIYKAAADALMTLEKHCLPLTHQSQMWIDISKGDLRAALAARPSTEPVAWMDSHGNLDHGLDAILDPKGWTPLYAAAPPQRKLLPPVTHPDAVAALEVMNKEYNYPSNPANCARYGWEAARRYLNHGIKE